MSTLASRDHVVTTLQVLEGWYGGLKADRLSALADGIYEEGPTHEELEAMLRACKREWKSRFFPTISVLLLWLRPPSAKGPDHERPAEDAVVRLERERDIQVKWLRHYEGKGDENRAAAARRDVEKLEERINARLEARGQARRHLGAGVEDFGSLSTTQYGFQDWRRGDEEDSAR